MVDLNAISKPVSDQSKAARKALQTRSPITKTGTNSQTFSLENLCG
jgi:hypothetical protein